MKPNVHNGGPGIPAAEDADRNASDQAVRMIRNGAGGANKMVWGKPRPVSRRWVPAFFSMRSLHLTDRQ